jgi:hypothetical protein
MGTEKKPRKVTVAKAKAATTTRTRRKKVVPAGAEQIAERAYFIHLDEGGDAFANWLRAERELAPA